MFTTYTCHRPAYETLVEYAVPEPNDKIAFPVRAATSSGRAKQRSRHGVQVFLEVEEDSETHNNLTSLTT